MRSWVVPMDSLLHLCLQTLCRGEIEVKRCHVSGSPLLDLVCGPTLLEKLLVTPTGDPSIFLPTSLADKVVQALAECGTLTSGMLARLLSLARISSLPLSHVTDLGTRSWDFSALPPLAAVKRIDLTYVSAPFDSNLIDYLMTAKDSLVCLSVIHVESVLFSIERFAGFRNLQQLDLISCPVLPKSVPIVLSSLLGLRSLSLADLDVSLYSILCPLSNLVHLLHLDLHKLPIVKLSDAAAAECTLSNDHVMSCVRETFGKLYGIQHLDISAMRYESEGTAIVPKLFVTNILSQLKNLEWLDVSETPGLTLTWVLSELEQMSSLDKLQVLSFLDVSDYNDVKASGRLPSQLQIVSPSAGQLEPLLQSQYLKHGNTALKDVLRSITDWPDGTFDINTIQCLVSFCLQGLTMMRDFRCDVLGLYRSLDVAYFSSVDHCPGSYKQNLHQITEKVVENLLVSCFVSQDNIRHQVLLWRMVSSVLDSSKAHLNTWLSTRIMSFAVWSLEIGKNPELVASDEVAGVQLIGVCLKAANRLVLKLDKQQCSYFGSDLGLVDILMSLLRDMVMSLLLSNLSFDAQFTEEADIIFSILWSITDVSMENCTRVLFPIGGLDGARFLIDFGFHFRHDSEAAICVLGTLDNVAEHPHLRKHLCFEELFHFIDIALDMDNNGHMVQITAGHLLCELYIDETLKSKMTDFGMAKLLAKLESVFTSIPVKRTEDEDYGGCYRNLHPFVKMIGCLYAPQVVLFGLWRIASLCYVNPHLYCPMAFHDGAVSAVRQIEGPAGLTESFHEIIGVIETSTAGYEDSPVQNDTFPT